jgi:CheY-like chemotaxis protein
MHKILIVDDDKKIVTALSIRLRAEGYEVVAAFDGPTGTEAAIRQHPALIIMDISLPFSNGLRTVRQIQRASGMAETPVIFITASKLPGVREQADALGAAGFFEKPYEANELLALIHQLLEQPVEGRSTAG